jgi:hypothetical protein
MIPKAFMNHKLLRLPQVKQTTGLSKSTIYARIAEGTFPRILAENLPSRPNQNRIVLTQFTF